MRILSLLAAAGMAVALAFTGSAVAAPAGTTNWSGFYIGAVGSGGLYTVEQEDYWCFNACNAPTLQDWDAAIGGQVGVNWQNGNLVLGIVGDFSTGFEQSEEVVFDSTQPDGVFWNADWNWYSTARVLVGMSSGNAMVYVTGGAAIVDVDYAVLEYDDGVIDCTATDCAAYSDTEVGYTAGAGVAFPIATNFNMTFEYIYVGLPWEKARYTSAGANATDDYVSWTTSAHLARLGLVWQLN